MATARSVAVIGAGTMGNGIAQTFASHGVPTTLVDLDEALLERGIGAIGKSLGRFVKKEKLTQAQADEIVGRISSSTSMEALREVVVLEFRKRLWLLATKIGFWGQALF